MSSIKPPPIFHLLISGSAARALLLFSNLAATFIMMPFLVHQLGDRQYGFWSIIGTVTGYFGFFDFGLSSAVSRFVSRAIGKSDKKEVNAIISNSLFLFISLALIMIIVSVSVAFFGSQFLSQEDRPVFRDCILIMGITLAISFPVRAFTGALFAQLRHSLFSFAEFFGLIIKFTLIIYFIQQGSGLKTLAFFNALGQITSCLLTSIFFLKTQKEFKLAPVSVPIIKELFSYAGFTFTAQLADIVRFRLSPMVIMANLGFSLVTLYNIADRLMDYFMQMMLSIAGTLSPLFSKYEGEKNYHQINEKFQILSKITAIIALWIGSGIFIFSDFFIEKWMGVEYLKAYGLLQILTIAYTIALMQTATNQLMYGISKHKFVAALSWVEAILNITVSVIAIRFIGLLGVAIGLAVPMLLLKGVVQPFYICSILKFKVSSYFGIFVVPLVITVLYSLLFRTLFQNFLKPDYMLITFYATFYSCGFFLLMFFIGMGKKVQSALLSVINLKKDPQTV